MNDPELNSLESSIALELGLWGAALQRVAMHGRQLAVHLRKVRERLLWSLDF
jgi:hypothetical protein